MEEKKHGVRLTERKRMELCGIEEVVSFREDAAELESVLGTLQITGTGLHMEKLDLDTGEVILTGEITSLYYPDPSQAAGKGLFKRIFS